MSIFFEKYKRFIVPIFLILIYIIYTVLTWGKWGTVVSDCFKELIIPQAMLDGKILYTDITSVYPPLAYQFNTVLFKFFGDSLNVLYLSGIICTLIILTLLYKLAEKKASLLTTFTFILTSLEIFIFRIIQCDHASWYFPYTYSFLYAFVLCIVSLFFYFLFTEKYEKKYLYLSALSIGFSIACKFDFLFFILLFVYEIIKNKSFKDFFYCLILFILPLLCSYGIWFLTGGNIGSFVAENNILINYWNGSSVKTFNENVLIQHFSENLFLILKNSVNYFLLIIFKILLISFLLVFISKKVQNRCLQILFYIVVFLTGYFLFLTKITVMQNGQVLGLNNNLVFIPYIVWLGAIFLFFNKLKKRNYTYKEKFYFLLTSAAFLMSYRLLLAVFIGYIGNFIIVIYWFAFIFLILEILPEYIFILKSDFYKKIISITLILYGLTYTMTYLSIAKQKICKLESSKGSFYTTSMGNSYNSSISYIKKNTNEKDIVLVLDEGTVINYFTGRKTDMKNYCLNPHLLDALGEDNVLYTLSKNPPDYIILTNCDYPYEGYFGIDYAQKIWKYILNNYQYIVLYTDPNDYLKWKITIFRKK